MSRKKVPAPEKSTKKKEADGAFRPFTALRSMRDELKAEEARSTAKVAPPKAAPKATPVSAEEEALSMHRLMSGVTPLAAKSTRIPRSQEKLMPSGLQAQRALGDAPAREEDEAVHAHLRALVEGGRFEVQDDGRRVEGARHGTPPELVRKLRRGLLPIDGRLDLHGQTAAGAQKALEQFLGAQRARGERCVLVVHGKGEHSPGRVGVLRGEIAAWLSQGAGSIHVAAFTTARDEDGGEGAVYILLAR
jgi:DNA-nicking Smr family endonuclease